MGGLFAFLLIELQHLKGKDGGILSLQLILTGGEKTSLAVLQFNHILQAHCSPLPP